MKQTKKKEVIKQKIVEREKRMAIATKFATCRCNICGAFIPEGDDTCDNGHTLGEQYSVN